MRLRVETRYACLGCCGVRHRTSSEGCITVGTHCTRQRRTRLVYVSYVYRRYMELSIRILLTYSGYLRTKVYEYGYLAPQVYGQRIPMNSCIHALSTGYTSIHASHGSTTSPWTHRRPFRPRSVRPRLRVPLRGQPPEWLLTLVPQPGRLHPTVRGSSLASRVCLRPCLTFFPSSSPSRARESVLTR